MKIFLSTIVRLSYIPRIPIYNCISIVSKSHQYWGVALDGKVIKTIFKDDLLCPTKALAVTLAEEWESQHDTINLKALYLVTNPYIS